MVTTARSYCNLAMANESGIVGDFFKGKTILITGATGFLSKVLVEKILRVQPNIKKLYLIVRAPNPNLASQRLRNEVFEKELFRMQRDSWGAEFWSFISEKVVAVAGDVSKDMFGLKDQNLIEEMLQDINIVVHSAATTKLDERFDIAIGTNTMGAFNSLNFAKNCPYIEIFLYVSTAYVCGEQKGIIYEETFQMGETLNCPTTTLDINLENKLIEEKLSELRAQNANEKTITSVMKEFGTARAKFHGWPNTYVFTKAMAEMIMVNMKDSLPLIFTRPTMIASTISEPFPGWIEGVRTFDFVVVEYFKGTIAGFVGRPEIIFDAIPADMVVNSMISALVVHSSKNPSKILIYHISSSLRNPFKYSDLQDLTYSYITKNPWIIRNRKSGSLTEKLILYPSTKYEFRPNMGPRLERIMNLYQPYSLFEGIFDDKNAEILRIERKRFGITDENFNFDPKNIDWKDYMMNIHFAGLLKYNAMKYSVQSKM